MNARSLPAAAVLCTLVVAACEGVTVNALDGPGACFAQGNVPGETALGADDFVESAGVKVNAGAAAAADVGERLSDLGVRAILLNDRVEPGVLRGLAHRLGLRGLVLLEDVEAAPAALAFYGDRATSIAFRHVDASPLPVGWGDKIRGLQQRLFALVKNNPATRDVLVVGPNVQADDQLAAVGDLSAWADAGAMFPWRSEQFPQSPGPRAEIDLARHALVYPNRPMVVEQVGIPVDEATGATEAIQGKYLLRMMLEHFRLGILRTYFLELYDSVAEPGASQLGLIRLDGSPRPGFTGLARLLNLLADPGPSFAPARLGFQITGGSAALHHLLLQKRNGVYTLALWLEIDSSDADVQESINLTFAAPARALTVFTPLASSAPVQRAAGSSLAVTVSDGVTLVQIDLGCR